MEDVEKEEALAVKVDEYIAEVKVKFNEGMKDYNSYVVQDLISSAHSPSEPRIVLHLRTWILVQQKPSQCP